MNPTGRTTATDDSGLNTACGLPAESVEAIVDRYQRPLLAYAMRMLSGDHAAAQDAVQETFLRLCREDRSKVESHVAAWLFAVCRTRVLDMQRTFQPTPIDAAEITMADPRPGAAEVASDAEDAGRLTQQIDQLSSRQQEVLRLRMQAGLSYREIADVTGLTVGNVGFHLHEAVRSLRQAFSTS